MKGPKSRFFKWAYGFEDKAMSEPRKLSEFWITLTFVVDALDHEQAQEIARDLLAHGREGNIWNVTSGDIAQIEKAS